MAMVPNDLADKIKNALGFGAQPTSKETKGMAQSIIDEMKAALVNNPPGTIVGVAPPSGGPLTAGAGTGGLITGMTPPSLAGRFVSNGVAPSQTPQILGMASAICTHFQTGLVVFAVGGITGSCTNTPTSPGALTGAGANGTIVGLAGPALAGLMSTSYGSVSPQLLAMCTAIVTYVTANAKVAYASGSVTGVCSAGGGPIVAGTGVGGTIA